MDKMPPPTKSQFAALFEAFSERAIKRFEENGSHSHVVLLFGERGLLVVPCEVLMVLASASGKANDDREAMEYVLAGCIEASKDGKAIAMIQIMEGWCVVNPGTTEDAEQAVERYARLKREHGGTLANVPGRLEVLIVRGLYGDRLWQRTWKIERRGEEYWLRQLSDTQDRPNVPAPTRMSGLEASILENYEEAIKSGTLKP